MPNDLKIDNLITGYKKFQIKNINFELVSGDILGLVGGSGSGKSTLIKTILGTKKAIKGSMQYIQNKTKKNIIENLGYSPQENALFPFLTLEENIYTFGRLMNVPDKEIKKRMDYLLKRFNLIDELKKKIKELSGGMQKRADIAVGLIHNPDIIIFDEPFNGLDIALQKFIWKLLRELAKEGKILIISSHMIPDIQKNCNKIGLIEKGNYYDTKAVLKLMNYHNFKNLNNFLEKIFDKTIDIEN